MQLMNIFKRPYADNTTYSPDGTFREYSKWDWYGVSLTFVKRFGNQKVKENTKTDVEKNSGVRNKIILLNVSGSSSEVRFFY